MKYLTTLFILCLCTACAWSETLGQALDQMSVRVAELQTQSQGDSWGHQTLSADLGTLQAQIEEMSRSLQGSDAEQVVSAQRQFETALRQVKTSNSMVGLEIEPLLRQGDHVSQRLQELRLRFGGRATQVNPNLAQVPLEESAELHYRNPAHLLIDVRNVRDASARLGNNGYFRRGYYFNYGLRNLDVLQLRDLQLAAVNLERRLSVNYGDVQESLPAWQRLRKAYRRLGYVQSSPALRQLERSMDRLEQFYSSM